MCAFRGTRKECEVFMLIIKETKEKDLGNIKENGHFTLVDIKNSNGEIVKIII